MKHVLDFNSSNIIKRQCLEQENTIENLDHFYIENVQNGNFNICENIITLNSPHDLVTRLGLFQLAIKHKKFEIAKMLEQYDFSCNTFHSQFIEHLAKDALSYKEQKVYENYFDYLDSKSLGNWDKSLIQNVLAYSNSDLIPYTFTSGRFKLGANIYVILRAKCEQYFQEIELRDKKKLLDEIEELLKQFKEKSFPPSGAFLPYESFNSGSLLMNVYLSKEENLIQLFAAYLPIPTVEYFKDKNIPNFIQKTEDYKNKMMVEFINKNNEINYHVLETKIVNLQRLIRANIRHKEEQHRLPTWISNVSKNHSMAKNFGVPYKPRRCSLDLSERIFQTALQIKFFKQIKHETKNQALASIFDNCLYGRKTLLMNYIPFNPAALWPDDVRNGDANVICFGAEYGFIDTNSKGNVELILQIDKLSKGDIHTPFNTFFKQQDFGFEFNHIRKVRLNEHRQIRFRHTGHTRCKEQGHAYMHISDSDLFNHFGALPYSELISYDMENIDAVLMLNFFKYLDNVVTYENQDATTFISSIYQDIENMSQEQLYEFLKNLGMHISDTMEYNFFGAHKIDFNSLIEIRDKQSGFILNIANLISELQEGNLELFLKARKIFPSAFQSYRFIEHLASKTENLITLEELNALWSVCKIPSWYPSNKKFDNKIPVNAECEAKPLNNNLKCLI